MKNFLAQAGYQLNSAMSVWSRAGYNGIAYSDGDEVEERIAFIIAQATDLNVLSTELRKHCTDWPSLYHLSSSRANILRPFQDNLTSADVLEIGAGCGAITRYLGECRANVLALEGSPRRAAITRSRTRDLPNVTVVTDKLDEFTCAHQFDVITLIGVLEYANLFTQAGNPSVAMLEKVRALLKPQGKLIIAIENQLGLKYFAGAPEDHLGVPMYGIEGHYRKDQPQTYGRQELAEMLMRAGFANSEFMAPFPDYKLPASIITERGFKCAGFDAGALASQSVRRDPQLPPHLAFSPELVWPGLVQNGIALDLANSFLILAEVSNELTMNPSVLAYHYTSERADIYCKETLFLLTKDSTIELRYHLLVPHAKNHFKGKLLCFDLPESDDYVSGRPLLLEMIDVVARDGWRIEQVGKFLWRHLHIVESFVSLTGKSLRIDSITTQLPGQCFDLVPQNIIITPDGSWNFIDSEWVFIDELPVGWLVFRSLLLLTQSLSRFGSTNSIFTDTRMGFFYAAFKAAGLDVSKEDLENYGNMEAMVQAEVSGLPSDVFLNWWASSPLPRQTLHQALVDRDGQIASLNQVVTDRDGLIASLNQVVTDRDGLIASLNQIVTERDRQIASLNQVVTERDGQIASLHSSIREIYGSRSWRITSPLRFMTSTMRKVRNVLLALPHILQKGQGLRPTFRKTLSVMRSEGLLGVKIRLKRVWMRPTHGSEIGAASQSTFLIVPHYIDPNLDSVSVALSTEVSIAVHLHLYYTGMLKEFVSYLNNIPVQYDLYVSVPESCDAKAIQIELNALLARVKSVIVEPVPNRGRDISPFIIQFGERLSHYEIIAHFFTKKSHHNSELAEWGNDILNMLLGSPSSSGGRVAHIIDLLQTTAKIVFPEGRTKFIKYRSDWAANDDLAKYLLEKFTQLLIQDFPVVTYSEGQMFWARTECLKDLLGLPINYSDFQAEPIAAESTIDHALERLVLIFASKYQGHFVRIHNGDSIRDYRYYEEQQDYSSSIIHSDIKVLSYYLPQFHPTPENDLWHGNGFTEWTKVRAANPLFDGHYQQHIPHSDIGYYLLDSPDVLRQQAELMRQAGVHGQVFYHYWFSGKLILEEPARILLNNPDINMPFCFCWANENWTRRWDGNEKEILLGQNYSAQDAQDFIHYLIPFFRDPRYIKVEGSPVLFVYRPSSLPDSQEYLDIWKRECARLGIKSPYVVAVLTRGATNPKKFGMDAGVERVLHDWTDGAVTEINNTLQCYQPINGSVLPYDDVVDFYTGQTDVKDFTYFRSLVPIWDNTARYGLEAYMLHNSTPQRFQDWIESSIAYTQATLPTDRQFVLINAWNEWAEGTHLEPDSRYGYSYLNSVGRALSGLPYSGDLNLSCSIPMGTKVHLFFPSFVLDQLQKDCSLQESFLFCLSRSSVFKDCSVSINASELIKDLPVAVQAASDEADFILEFRHIGLFETSVIEKMLQTACQSGSAVIANSYDNTPLIEVSANGSVHSSVAFTAPLLLLPKSVVARSGYKNVRMRTDAHYFVTYPNSQVLKKTPAVTTIIRFHKSANINELRNALYCLSAMRGCVVIPLIAAQDLSKEQIVELEGMLNDFTWEGGLDFQVHHYQSLNGKGDLRSKMLNESLKKVTTRYAAFLDFDDLLMPHAYEWLIDRLKKTGKAVSFGRVYSTSYDGRTELLLERKRTYEYGNSFDEFVNLNHAPLHSFMLDLERLDLRHIVYFEDQRYMEDYLLTLQLFTRDNADWASLAENFYIGDYIHSIDRTHTLAFSNEQERQNIFSNPEYMICEQRICDMRKTINSRTVI